ncbi:16S rRNA (adenine(1518)-N(6)/adenine(1519)-N(6))-dimethyltransferase RsmA [Rickettsiales bacterium LUAb2]
MDNNFQTKKYLGQHLLIDNNIINQIINCAANISELNVVEVGPGTGNLTKALLPHVRSLTAIEKDTTTLSFLTEIKNNYPDKFNFILGDALKINLLDLKPTPNAIIANLPYNVGTLMFCNWLEICQSFKYFILMFQLEVAERITAKQGDNHYGRLALFTKLFGDAQLLFKVSKNCFMPPPKVDSAVIIFTPHLTPLDINVKLFETITNAAFNQRRKMLRQSLKQFNFEFNNLNINPEHRPENLSFADFCNLTKQLEKNSIS